MTLCVIILARRGSKRCSGKNEMRFDDRGTIVDIAVQKARGLVPTSIVISTDIDSILEKYPNNGKELAWAEKRPEELCGDNVTSEAVVLSMLDDMWDTCEHVPDSLCLMQATTPLLRAQSLIEAGEIFHDFKMPALVSVNQQFQPNGAFYFINTEDFWEQKTFYPVGMQVYKLAQEESIDINYPHEYRIAQAVAHGKVFGEKWT